MSADNVHRDSSDPLRLVPEVAIHVSMYGIADKYGVQGLKSISVQRLKAALQYNSWNPESQQSYTSEMVEELAVAVQAAWKSIHSRIRQRDTSAPAGPCLEEHGSAAEDGGFQAGYSADTAIHLGLPGSGANLQLGEVTLGAGYRLRRWKWWTRVAAEVIAEGRRMHYMTNSSYAQRLATGAVKQVGKDLEA